LQFNKEAIGEEDDEDDQDENSAIESDSKPEDFVPGSIEDLTKDELVIILLFSLKFVFFKHFL